MVNTPSEWLAILARGTCRGGAPAHPQPSASDTPARHQPRARATGLRRMADHDHSVSLEHRPEASLLRQAYGLRIRSSLPLPELPPAADGLEADLEILAGPVPTELPGATDRGVRYQAAPGQLLLIVDGIARFLISDGRRIVIESPPEADPDDVRLFLYGSAFAALLHQRGDLVLHGSAIATGDTCVAFLGASGVGKSTLAMACQRHGWMLAPPSRAAIRTISNLFSESSVG